MLKINISSRTTESRFGLILEHAVKKLGKRITNSVVKFKDFQYKANFEFDKLKPQFCNY